MDDFVSQMYRCPLSKSLKSHTEFYVIRRDAEKRNLVNLLRNRRLFGYKSHPTILFLIYEIFDLVLVSIFSYDISKILYFLDTCLVNNVQNKIQREQFLLINNVHSKDGSRLSSHWTSRMEKLNTMS